MKYVTEQVNIAKHSGDIAPLMNSKDAEGYDFIFMVLNGNVLTLTFKLR